MVFAIFILSCYMGRTGPVGPAMARPTFELGRTFFLNLSQNCKLLRIKSVYNKNATSSDRKIATAALNLRTWDSDT